MWAAIYQKYKQEVTTGRNAWRHKGIGHLKVPHILDLRLRQKQVVSFMFLLLYPVF